MNNNQINWGIIIYVLNMDFPEVIETYCKRKLSNSLDLKALSQQCLKVEGVGGDGRSKSVLKVSLV